MKLTVGLIVDRLSKSFGVDCAVSCDKNILVGRPVFYDDSSVSDNICIISGDDIVKEPLKKGVYISSERLPITICGHEIEQITVPSNVSEKALFNELQKIFDYYDEWEIKMTAIIDEDKGYNELIQCSTSYIKHILSIVDEDFTYIAYSDELVGNMEELIEDNRISQTMVNELISSPVFERVVEENDIFEYCLREINFLCYNFKRGKKYLGRVIMSCGNEPIKEPDKFLFKVLISRLETMLRKYGSFLIDRTNFSELREIVKRLINNEYVEKQTIEKITNIHRWSVNDTYAVIRLQPEFRHEWQLHTTYLIPQIERQWLGTCALEYMNYVIILINKSLYTMSSGKDIQHELAYFIREGLMLAGVSRSFSDLTQLSAYYKQTEIAVSMGRLTTPTTWCYYFDDYALRFWQKHGIGDFSPEQICCNVLIKLKQYDRENSTQLYTTLVSICKNNYNFSKAADALFIHRTSLIYRVNRIVELTKLDLDNTEQRLYLELSYRYLEET